MYSERSTGLNSLSQVNMQADIKIRINLVRLRIETWRESWMDLTSSRRGPAASSLGRVSLYEVCDQNTHCRTPFQMIGTVAICIWASSRIRLWLLAMLHEISILAVIFKEH